MLKFLSKIDNNFKEILKNSIIAFFLKVLGIINGYIFSFLVIKTLGAKAWGVFTIFVALLQIASILGRLGFDTLILRYTAKYINKNKPAILAVIYKKTFNIIIISSTFISILIYLLSPILSNKIFHNSYLTYPFHIVSLILIPYTLLLFHSEGIRGLKKIKEYMFLQQSGLFIISILIFYILLLFIDNKLILPIISYSFSIILLSLISIYIWYKYTKINFVFYKNSRYIQISYKYLFINGLPILFASSLTFFMNWIDIIMLGMFRTVQEVGIYNIILKVAMIISLPLTAINTILAPKFAEYWDKRDKKNFLKLAQRSTKLIFWTTLPVLILFLLFHNKILNLFGEDFQKGNIALLILLLGQFINAASGSVGIILLMTGHQKAHQNITLTGTILNIMLNYLLIPYYGMLGAAIANTVTTIYWNILFSIKVYKILNGWIFYPPIWRFK